MRALTPICLSMLAGCAFSHVGEDGDRHVIGPVLISSPPELESAEGGALDQMLEITSLGFAWHLGFAGGVLGLGYIRLREASLRSSPVPAGAAAQEGTPRPLRRIFSLYSTFPHGTAPALGGTVFAVETLGLAVIATETESAVSIGYGSTALVAVPDDVFIAGNPLHELTRTFSERDAKWASRPSSWR